MGHDAMSDKYAELDSVLDEESWEWLSDTAPKLATTIEKLVGKGLSAEEISRRVVQRSGAHRVALAQRCEMAARFLLSVSARS